MKLQQALRVVLELAENNMLDDKDAISPELEEEQVKQAKALAKVQELFNFLFINN